MGKKRAKTLIEQAQAAQISVPKLAGVADTQNDEDRVETGHKFVQFVYDGPVMTMNKALRKHNASLTTQKNIIKAHARTCFDNYYDPYSVWMLGPLSLTLQAEFAHGNRPDFDGIDITKKWIMDALEHQVYPNDKAFLHSDVRIIEKTGRPTRFIIVIAKILRINR